MPVFGSTVAQNQSSEHYLDITTLFTCCSKYATKDGEAGLRAVLQMLRDELGDGHGHVWSPDNLEHRHQPVGHDVAAHVHAAPNLRGCGFLNYSATWDAPGKRIAAVPSPLVRARGHAQQ